ncbi:MAG: hypothetical protein K0S44_2324 [Bacteroidetes bacterium]|nr:hypothetical protein [Bacteroidota bacterium]
MIVENEKSNTNFFVDPVKRRQVTPFQTVYFYQGFP